jgi:hypothetical protein
MGAAPPRFGNERHVPGVKRAHRRHERDRSAARAQLGDRRAQ